MNARLLKLAFKRKPWHKIDNKAIPCRMWGIGPIVILATKFPRNRKAQWAVSIEGVMVVIDIRKWIGDIAKLAGLNK